MTRVKRILVLLLSLSMVLTGAVTSNAATQEVSNLKTLAKIVKKHSLKHEGKYNIRYTGGNADLNSLFEREGDFFASTLSMMDNPANSNDADYMVGLFKWNAQNTLTWDADTGIIRFNLRFYETLKQTRYVTRRVKKIVSKLGLRRMGNYDKVKTIYQYICKQLRYSYNTVSADYSPYGALKNHKGVCNAYSLLMYKLCVAVNVPCKYIGGYFYDDKGARCEHAWNIVALVDKWYNMDITWDDNRSDGGCNYNYFLRGSKDFDSHDPSTIHTMDKCYRTGDFALQFPIAKKRFNPKTMSDVNSKIRIGGMGYSDTDLLTGIYPSSYTFKVKKGKIFDIQLQFKKGMEKLVESMSYSIIYGKERLASVRDFGILVDKNDGQSYTDLELKGGEKGSVRLKIYLYLKNGQQLAFCFSGEVT